MRATMQWMVALSTILATLATVGCAGDDDHDGTDDDAGDPPIDAGPDVIVPDSGPDVRDTGLPPGQCRRDSDCPDLGWCNGEPDCQGAVGATLGFCSYSSRCYDMPVSGCEQPSCNEDEDRCEIVIYDADGDGHYAPGCSEEPNDDCAEYDANRFPGNPEICDPMGHDEDCDPTTFGPDVDGDGAAAPICCDAETGLCGNDCNDHDAAIGPSGSESGTATCDGADNDCDGVIDEGCTCDAGMGDCDATAGCEISLATDPASCGRCGNACAAGESCVAGACNPAIAVAVGASSSCALRYDGRVDCWGSNRRGQLGDGGFADSAEAVAVAGLDGAVAEIAAGGEHVCARMVEDGSVRCWGYGGHGQLGDGEIRTSATPVAVRDLRDVVGIAAGRFHTCALRADGSVACWGYNAMGQLGDRTTSRRPTPVVVDIERATAIAAGGYQTCAITSEGVFCWGDYNGYSTPVTMPQIVAGADARHVGIAAGTNHVCVHAIDPDEVLCWGRNDYGELAGSWSGFASLAVEGLEGLFAGGDLTCATWELADRRGLDCYGSGLPLGLGLFGSSVAGPVRFASEVTALAASDGHACVISSGRVRCAGSNDAGQTGDGTFEYHPGFDVDVLGL